MATLADLYNLAVRYQQSGDLRNAEQLYRQILTSDPTQASVYTELGLVLAGQGKLGEAADCFRQAVRLNPQDANAHYNLGTALRGLGPSEQAIECFQKALRIDANHAPAYYQLGNVLRLLGQARQAEECYRQALRIQPDHADAWNDLGIVQFQQGRLDNAAECYQQALRVKSDHTNALSNLGITLKDLGNLDEAIGCFRKVVEIRPYHPGAHSDLVYALHYHPDQDASALLQECRLWNQRHVEPWAGSIRPHGNTKDPGRRLKIGYVSPDLREHPVGRFMLTLLENHDHDHFEIYCYASVRNPDAITARCRQHADLWQDSDVWYDDTGETVRRDGIDILVDLSMHSGGNWLRWFARKPAPVQVTYLAYCGTTGMSTMDYRLTDPYLDPPGQTDHLYAEQSVRLPETYWCYQPVLGTPAPLPPPSLTKGRVTFGCLNNFSKVTQPTLETWSKLLRAVPQADLILNAPFGNARARVRDFMAKRGVPGNRLIFVDRVPFAEYFQNYQRIDVALDPFPFGGGTTTCDALWMGVPVVTLAGQTAVGRGGVSILSNIGLTECIAQSTEEYIRTAMDLTDNSRHLSELRANLRRRMLGSPLMDAPRFARNIEAAYRAMWQKWCAV